VAILLSDVVKAKKVITIPTIKMIKGTIYSRENKNDVGNKYKRKRAIRTKKSTDGITIWTMKILFFATLALSICSRKLSSV
jgi:hypothetical protein